MPGLAGEDHVIGDDVRLAQQVVVGDALDTELLKTGVVDVGIVGNEPDAPGLHEA